MTNTPTLTGVLCSAKLRSALLTWAVVYPLITGLLLLLEPFVSGFALPLRTLILSSIMVPLMVYVAMPAARNLAGPWLDPRNPSSTGNTQ
ncbi:MAG: hypothetical protein AAF337_05290 [Pseudomonadota bacterium]